MIKTLSDMAGSPVKSPSFTMASAKNDRMAGSVPVWGETVPHDDFAENLAQSDQKQEFGFSDIIDIVNPLHHFPVVSNIYQSATDDTIGAIAKIVGGGLFGGPIGALVGAATVAYQYARDEISQDSAGQQLTALEGTTVALADLRAGYTSYNS